MIQLSSPSPELPAVLKEKSPEKAAGPKHKGFEDVMHSVRESREQDKKAVVRKKTSALKEASPGEKPVKAAEADSGIEQNGKSDKKAELLASMKKKAPAETQSVQMSEAAMAELREAGAQDVQKLLTQFLEQNQSTDQEESKSLSKAQVKKKTGEGRNALTSLNPKAPSKELHSVSEGESAKAAPGLLSENTAEKLTETDLSDDALLNKSREQLLIMNESGAENAETGFKETAQESLKTLASAPASKKSLKGESLQINVDDRRTVNTEDSPLLRKVDANESSSQVTLELVPEEELPGMVSEKNLAADSTGKTFSIQTAEEQKGAALLDRQLQNKGNLELAKNIKFVLKDNKEGEIKLILKPEALGRVRINLNLQENNIVGKIIVENNSVRQTFLNNLGDLTKALEDSGFDTASLDVSVGGGQAESQGRRDQDQPRFFAANAIEDLEGQIPVVYEEGVSLGQINLVV